ncbi:TniQ family protein [Streptacidiphilus sp. N1-12]|uniref:TniQ family protein n=2 Tax=Streptacidiphilus alkalitolerans TaxID=3342712 RepID=A0ABV6V5A7_9ACTN
MSTARKDDDVFEGDDRQYSLTRLPGWLESVDGPARARPERLSRAQLADLEPHALLRHNDRRKVWHANIGPIRTPQLLALHEDLAEILESNRQDGNKAKPAALVNAYPGLGKSTAVCDYGRTLHREQVALRGETTPEGNRRVPVVYIALSGNTHIRGLNAAICRFYGLPTSGDADTLAERAVDAALSTRTVAFIIDDVHFLAGPRANSARMANQLKYLSNVFPVTLIYIGVGVRERGILREGLSDEETLFAQFGRRTTPLTLPPFDIESESGREEWRTLLLTIERQLVLADAYPGMLADDLSDYLYARSTGHFASLMALVNRGSLRAIRKGVERLDEALMDRVRNDAAAEDARQGLLAELAAGPEDLTPRGPAEVRVTAWQGGHLPIFVEPIAGEALDSWLEAYARRLKVTAPALLSFLGLPGSRPELMTQRLTPKEHEALGRATGLSPRALTELTLEPYSGLTVSFHPSKVGMGRPPMWRYYGSNSRFCPQCLAETSGRWLLAWRQPWSFACLDHQCLLAERCPSCQQPVRARGTRVGGPSMPSLCTRGRQLTQGSQRPRISCGFPLSQAPAPPLPSHGLVLPAQEHVNAVLAKAASDRDAAREELLDLYILGGRVLAGLSSSLQTAPASARRVLDETGGGPPAQSDAQGATDVRSIALATTLARQAVPHPEAADPALLAWLTQAHQRFVAREQDPNSGGARSFAWRKASPRLAGQAMATWDRELTLAARLRYGTASPAPYWRQLTDEQTRARLACLPSKLWPAWAMRLLPPGLANIRVAESFRSASVALIALPGTRLPYRRAVRLLGQQFEAEIRQRASLPRALQFCPQTVLASTLTQLAWALDEHGSPIDYARRRDLFRSETTTLDTAVLTRLCGDFGWRNQSRQEDFARWYVLALLHGADPSVTSGKISDHGRRRPHLPAPLLGFLEEQAQANLDMFTIHEPLCWEPPESWATAPAWPGIEAEDLDREVHSRRGQQLVLRDGDPLSTLSITHRQLFCESRGITVHRPQRKRSRAPRTPRPTLPKQPRVPVEPRRRSKGIPRTGHLSPDQLRLHYAENGMTKKDIAELAGCSASTVAQALREAAIPTRPRRANGSIAAEISRDWLEEQYVRLGRSTLEIAGETGIHKSSIMKLLHRYGIPRHPTGWRSNPFSQLDVPMSPRMQTVSRSANSLPRLRNLAKLPGQPSLSAAARAIDIRRSVLRYQVDALEQIVGLPLITRTLPLAATTEGRAFLTETEQLVKLLDSHRERTTCP